MSMTQLYTYRPIISIRINLSVAATCVLDTTEANTFDNRTYPLELGNCWHVMMMLVPKLPADHIHPQNSRLAQQGLNRLDHVTVMVKGVGQKKVSIR
jgi:hypothetical protein